MYSYKAVVKKVIDGDTIKADIDLGFHLWLKRVRIRLAGIDAPSIKIEEGKVTKDRLIELLTEESTIIIEVEKIESDKYGRVLAIVWKENLNVNEWLVKEGYATEYKK